VAAQEPSDEELERRWKQGSAPAFSLLFERYYKRVYGFAYRFVQERGAAEDIAQRAFLNLYSKPPSGGQGTTFKALVFRVARNESLNHLKWRARRREVEVEAASDVPLDAKPPERRLDDEDQGGKLAEAFEHLPVEEREVMTLRLIQKLPFKEVCEVTGLTRDTVRYRIAKGLERLRAALLPQNPGGGS